MTPRGATAFRGPQLAIDDGSPDSSNGVMTMTIQMPAGIARPLKRNLRLVLDAVLPPRCLKCGQVVAAEGGMRRGDAARCLCLSVEPSKGREKELMGLCA